VVRIEMNVAVSETGKKVTTVAVDRFGASSIFVFADYGSIDYDMSKGELISVEDLDVDEIVFLDTWHCDNELIRQTEFLEGTYES
jgi:hypothetical protein